MTKITPFLWFNECVADIGQFYVDTFDNATLDNFVPGPDGKALVVQLTIEDQKVTLLNGGPHFQLNEAFSFVISCKDQAEVDRYWSALTADGGEESMCGWLKDKYGLSWQVTPTRLMELMTDPDPERAARANAAMMQMQKIVIADLEAAADGVPV